MRGLAGAGQHTYLERREERLSTSRHREINRRAHVLLGGGGDDDEDGGFKPYNTAPL